MARRRTGLVTVRGQRRATTWVASSIETAISQLNAGAARLDQSLDNATLTVIGQPLTVIRTRGEIWIQSDQAIAKEDPFGALGMCVVSEQARAAGVGSVPTPGAEPDSDLWFLHQFFLGGLIVSAAAPTSLQGSDIWSRYSFDSRAKRIVQDQEAIIVVVENSSATHGLNYLINFRMLLKLH